jgi:hypothetical protein
MLFSLVDFGVEDSSLLAVGQVCSIYKQRDEDFPTIHLANPIN